MESLRVQIYKLLLNNHFLNNKLDANKIATNNEKKCHFLLNIIYI